MFIFYCFVFNVSEYLQLRFTRKKKEAVQMQIWMSDGARADQSCQRELVLID